jgi:hypothetical protein
MAGKSIGFLTTKAHSPSDDEVRKRPELAAVRRIIDEWVLLEYACCWQPMNPEALVEAVNKSGVSAAALKFIGAELPAKVTGVVPFVPLSEYQKAVDRAIAKMDVVRLVNDRANTAYGRL